MAQAPSAQDRPLPTELNLVVVEGEGAINNIRQRVARDPVVRVEDENHKPIAGAIVVFTLPTEGATGDFNGQKTITVNTDAQGQAIGKGLRMNPTPGKVPIHITASYRGLAARTTINQSSVVPPGAKADSGGHHGALIGVLVAVGAAAGAGAAYALTHNSNSSSTPATPPPAAPTPIGITPGTGSISGGH